MNRKLSASATVYACFAGYIVQAIVNNFAPLLFLTFQSSFGISLEKIALLTTLNFGIQLLVDAASSGFVDRIGYRASIVIAHAMAAVGIAMMAVQARPLSGRLRAYSVKIFVRHLSARSFSRF